MKYLTTGVRPDYAINARQMRNFVVRISRTCSEIENLEDQND